MYGLAWNLNFDFNKPPEGGACEMTIPEPKCPICGEHDQDSRGLTLSFNYKLSEISDKLYDCGDKSYYIYVCKDCRGVFLSLLQMWLSGELVDKTTRSDRNIPVHVHGRTVMMNDEEWAAHCKKKEESGRTAYRLR